MDFKISPSTISAVAFAGLAAAALNLLSKRQAAKQSSSANGKARRASVFEVAGVKTRVCIASCTELMAQSAESANKFGGSGLDDRFLYSALEARRIPFDVRAWDETGVDWSQYDCIIVRTTWDYSTSERRAAQFKTWVRSVADAGVHVWNHPRIISWNISKRYLQELHDETGVPIIPTIYVAAHAKVPDLKDIMKTRGWKSLIIKPCVSAASRSSIRVRGNDDIAVARAQRFLSDMVTLGYDSTRKDAPPSDSSMKHSASNFHLHHLASQKHLVVPPPDVAAKEASALVAEASAAFDEATAQSPHEAAIEDSVPCEMMIQPYINSVEKLGELSVIVFDGIISHALRKMPVPGEFRTQEEYGAAQVPVTLSASEKAIVYKVLDSAKSVVERFEVPSSPITPGQVQHVLPRKLPSDALMVARVDFLQLTEESCDVFETVASPVAAGTADTPVAHVSPTKSPLLLLELEVIEPCLFFTQSPESADSLVTAIEKRLSKLAKH